MNSAVVVCSLSWVRRAWRQFHRRQVTPASSHHTTSRRRGARSTATPSVGGVEGFGAGGADQLWRTAIARQILPAHGQLMQHRDRVVEVGEPVDAGQPALGTTGQGLHTVAGALRLGPERPVGLAATPRYAAADPPVAREVLGGQRLRPAAAAPRWRHRRGRAPGRRPPAARRGNRAATRTPHRRRGRRRGTCRAGARSAMVRPPTAPTRRPLRVRTPPARTGRARRWGWRTRGRRRRGTPRHPRFRARSPGRRPRR